MSTTKTAPNQEIRRIVCDQHRCLVNNPECTRRKQHRAKQKGKKGKQLEDGE